MDKDDALSLEKLRIVDHLAEITRTLTVQGEQLKHLVEGQLVINKSLVGDGSEDSPGLIIDVDRLKQHVKDANFQRNAIWTSIVVMFFEHLRHLFFGK